MSKKNKCPKCGSTKTEYLEQSDMAPGLRGRGVLGKSCKKCGCSWVVSLGFDNYLSSDTMSSTELNKLKERGDGLRRAWSTESLIRKIRGF